MFKQTIPFTLKVNTPPPAIAKCVIAQTKTASATEPAYYVLCLQLPAAEMNRELNGSLVHKDIAGITINETSYSLSVNSAQKQFNANAGSPFIDKDSVEKLAADADEVPSGWTLYFKTNVAVGDAKKSYTISVKDEKGLYSKPVTAATQLSEPQPAQIDVIKGTKIASLSGDGTVPAQAIVIKADATTPEAQIKLSVPATGGVSATGVTIHYTLTEVGRTPAPEQTETSPITVDMPLNGSGEKMYALTYSTDGVGFKPSASKTVYYKVLKEHTVTFNLAGGNIGGNTNTITMTGIQGMSLTAPRNPSREGYTFTVWSPALSSPPTFPAVDTTYTAQWQEISKPAMRIKEGISAKETSYKESGTEDLVLDAKLYTNAKPLIIYKESGQAQLSITGSSGTTAYYQIDTGTEAPGTEISLSADGNTHKLTVWAKKGSDDSIKTVLYVQVKDALTTYTELKNVVKHASSNTFITIGSDLTCTEESSEIEINKALTIQCKAASSAPSRYIINANEKGRIFKVAAGRNLTLENLTLKKGKMGGDITTGIGGGIYIIKGGECLLKNCSITECKAVTGGALTVAGTCTLENSVVENNSCLASGSAAAANITPTGRLVLQGSTVIKNNKKANNAPDASAILVTGGITLKGAAKVETGNNIYLSVESAYITVDGTLTASPTAAGVSMPSFAAGRKVLDGALTSGSNIGKFTLVGQDAEQWKINASGELEAAGSQSSAVPVRDWEALRTAVKNATDGDVIEIAKDLTYEFTNTNSSIEVKKNITIKSKGSGTCTLNAGGKGADSEQSNDKSTGVFEVSGGKTLTLEKVTLTKTNCKTHYNAAGIYFNKGKNLTLTDCTIEKCKGKGTDSSGGIDIQEPKGTVSITDTTISECEAEANGGGINLNNVNNVQCTLQNVTIQRCIATNGGGGGVCVKAGALTITGGSFKENLAVKGGGIFVDKGTSAQACTVTISGTQDNPVVIANNEADHGGGLYNGGTANISYAKFEENTAKHNGGGIYNAGTCTMDGVELKKNKADASDASVRLGGGIFIDADAHCTLGESVEVIQNTVTGTNSNGGGIFVDKKSDTQLGTLTIQGTQDNPVVITKNEAQYSGGGLYSYGSVTIEYAEIKENTVAHDGGGMYNAGICTMNYVTIQDNTASDSTSGAGRGGGIYNEKTLTLTNTTVTDNAAKLSGGALHLESNETFKMSGSTVITVDSSKNDIYLTNDAFITLTDQLTTSEEKFARITLNSSGGYQEHRVVVKGDFSIPTNYADKFTITNNLLDAQKWKLSLHDNELKLKKK